MKWFFCVLCITCLVCNSVLVFGQSSKVAVSKEPSWVVKNEINYNKTSLDKDATGSLDIYYEAQVSLADRCRYIRQCKKLISQAGVQEESTISVSFDPSYQQLFFHSIKIIRSGETLNRLQLSKIKTIHQEADLKDFIYNGTNEAVLILEDTRPGDIIEYSYSIKGVNPVFKDKYAGEISTQFSVPVYDLFYRIIVPAGRTIAVKNINETIQPEIKTSNGQQVYEWHKSDVNALVTQDYIPSWYNPFPRVLVSEYKTWKEVNDWAAELFPIEANLSAALQEKISAISKAYTDDAGRTAAALRVVQDDIRYMGIEMGRHSHKPATPSKVFAQRFGDCKEKSYLLCAMLNSMKIEASPVLINTEAKKDLNNMLPAPTNFDHVTVRVKVGSDYYYFDPTIAYQRGTIKDIFYPDYQAGLVITAGTTDLTTIPFHSASSVHISDDFKVASMSGAGSLVVTTQFKGDEADIARSRFNRKTSKEILNDTRKFYASYYEDIKADSISFSDNDSSGVFTSVEYYSLPDFWTLDKKNTKKFSFSPFAVDGVFKRPKEKNRTMPLALSYPVSYQEEISIVLPEEWRVEAGEKHLKTKAFTYNSRFYNIANRVYLSADYENHQDFVAVDEAPEYLKSIREYDDNENYFLSYGENAESQQTTPVKADGQMLFSVVLILAGIIITIWWNNKRR